MNFAQKMYVRTKFKEKLSELHSESFEEFFHELMCARYPDFVPVRTHGNLGDQGADGLSLHSSTLYACYGPRIFDAAKVRDKFRSDLEKAVASRRGQFSTFAFVHNDLQGVHPEITSLLAEARVSHPDLSFELLGGRRLC